MAADKPVNQLPVWDTTDINTDNQTQENRLLKKDHDKTEDFIKTIGDGDLRIDSFQEIYIVRHTSIKIQKLIY